MSDPELLTQPSSHRPFTCSKLAVLLSGLYLLCVAVILTIYGRQISVHAKFFYFAPIVGAAFWWLVFGRSSTVYCIALLLGIGIMVHRHFEVRTARATVEAQRGNQLEILSETRAYQLACEKWITRASGDPPSLESVIRKMREGAIGTKTQIAEQLAGAQFLEEFEKKQSPVIKGLLNLKSQMYRHDYSSREELDSSLRALQAWKSDAEALDTFRHCARATFVGLLQQHGVEDLLAENVANGFALGFMKRKSVTKTTMWYRRMSEVLTRRQQFLLDRWGSWRWCEERRRYIFDAPADVSVYNQFVAEIKGLALKMSLSTLPSS